MRTTIEITDEQRASLLSVAAARGEKGFSGIVREAIDRYLAADPQQTARVEAALAVPGRLPPGEADELAERCAALRAEWR